MAEVNYDAPNMEMLAKEYNKVLSDYNANNMTDDNSILERVMLLLEDQVELTEINMRCFSPRVVKTWAYIKNLTYRSIVKVNQMLNNSAYIPSFRNGQLDNMNFLVSRLLDIEIDIFTLLDKLKEDYTSRAELLQFENRKTAFLSSLM